MAKWGELAMLVDAKRMIDMEHTLRELVTTLRFYAEGTHYVRSEGEYDLTEVERDEGDKARAILRKVGAL